MKIIILIKSNVGPLKNGGLNLDLESFKTSKKKIHNGVPTRYQVLNREELTIVDALRLFKAGRRLSGSVGQKAVSSSFFLSYLL